MRGEEGIWGGDLGEGVVIGVFEGGEGGETGVVVLRGVDRW